MIKEDKLELVNLIMGKAELKSSLHQLIDKTENSDLLQSIHDFLDQQKQLKGGDLWSDLTADQKEEVIQAFEESENDEKLIPHSEVLKSAG